MNDESLEKLRLQAVEASLADAMPSISPARQQQLLYACAFAAGRRAGGKRLRLWQGAAASLVLLLGIATLPGRDRTLAAGRKHDGAEQELQQREPLSDEPPVSPLGHRPALAVALDAWQTRPSAESFDEELAQFASAEPQVRSLALKALSRKSFEQ